MVWYVLLKTVSPKGRSFHSIHATSQALHPMHVVVSMSLQAVNPRWASSPGTLPACPDIFWMRSVAWLIEFLRFLQLHEKALEFRCVSVGIKYRRRQQIHQRPRVLAFVLGDAPITLMNGNADLVDLLSVDHHRLEPLRDHRFCDVLPADAGDFHFFAARESHFLRHLRGYLDKWLRHQLHVHRIVLRPVVV